jgi:hypothetical protein
MNIKLSESNGEDMPIVYLNILSNSKTISSSYLITSNAISLSKQ